MVKEQLKEMPNPYSLDVRLSSKEFIGREKETNLLKSELDDYTKTGNLKNILISGEKSIGKTTLLNRFVQILQDYQFEVFEYELPRNSKGSIDEFDFFKEMINQMFDHYGAPEGSFFDQDQSNIWYSLVSNKYEHQSNFTEREIEFATLYANRKKGINEKISDIQMKKDFEKILNNLISSDMDINGFAIVIDEFQELKENILLLHILRKLTEEIPWLIMIGAGLPIILKDGSYEKINRNSTLLDIKKMSEKEILNLIYKPFELTARCSRYEARTYFDIDSVKEILQRSGGNPLHIKILCETMFNYFKNNISQELLILNRVVMEEVIIKFSTISEKSRNIKNSLESCQKEEMEAFSRLFRYEGLNIKSMIILRLAFSSIQKDEVENIRSDIIEDLKLLKGLSLFEIIDKSIDFNKLEKFDVNDLANVKYKFVGNPIDKLYAKYYFEDSTDIKLDDNSGLKYEDLLTIKLALNLGHAILSKKIEIDKSNQGVFMLNIKPNDNDENEDQLLKDLNKLEKIKDNSDDEKSLKAIEKVSEKYDLNNIAHFASVFEYEGYYLLVTKLTVKGSMKTIHNYFPVIGNIDKLIKTSGKITDYSKLIKASLDDYIIKINSMILCYVPKQSLLKICFVDLSNETDVLYQRVYNRNCEEAVVSSERIALLKSKSRESEYCLNVRAENNHIFCLLNLGESNLDKKLKIFEIIKDKFLPSKINFAYMCFCKNQLKEAASILKKIFRKKIGKNEELIFINLAIKHPNLSNSETIVEDVSAYNIVAWNLALIYVQLDKDISIVNSFLKAVQLSGNDKFIDQRVRNWRSYYRKDIKEALSNSKQLLKQCENVKYLHENVLKDIQIFEQELM